MSAACHNNDMQRFAGIATLLAVLLVSCNANEEPNSKPAVYDKTDLLANVTDQM